MFSMICLANNINTEWQITFKVFNTAMLVLLADLLALYIFATDAHPFKDRDLRAFIVTLSIEFVLILIGFLMPLMLYPMFNPENVNFPHFVEGLGLIIIVTFGEL